MSIARPDRDASPEMAGKLAEIAAREHSTPDAVAAGAVADLIGRENAIVEAIQKGRSEIEAGLGIPHDQVVNNVRAYLDEVRSKA